MSNTATEDVKIERVIAVDPGYDRVGVAILERERGKSGVGVVTSFCIQTDPTLDFFSRIKDIIKQLSETIVEYEPHSLAFETLFFSTNTKTAMRVSEARGAIASVAINHGLNIWEVNPGHVKIAVTGVGNSNKAEVQKMVQLLLRLPAKKRLDDEYDALAVGVAYFAHNKMR